MYKILGELTKAFQSYGGSKFITAIVVKNYFWPYISSSTNFPPNCTFYKKVSETKSSLFHAAINLLFMQIIQKMPRNATFYRTTNVGPNRPSRPSLI